MSIYYIDTRIYRLWVFWVIWLLCLFFITIFKDIYSIYKILIEWISRYIDVRFPKQLATPVSSATLVLPEKQHLNSTTQSTTRLLRIHSISKPAKLPPEHDIRSAASQRRRGRWRQDERNTHRACPSVCPCSVASCPNHGSLGKLWGKCCPACYCLREWETESRAKSSVQGQLTLHPFYFLGAAPPHATPRLLYVF